uniref:Carrier domain-containing protein n=1 Tax=Pyrodinium bahamense TaxID=73915 RepID=A0A7S0BC73_9DINO
MADMLRLVLKAYLLKAGIARYDRSSGARNVVVESLRKAEQIARAELVLFRQAGCLRGHAAMQLSIAEILLDKKAGSKTSAVALQSAMEARSLFQKMGDKKMEATALLALVSAYGACREKRKALEAASTALAIFREIGDRPGEAKSLHAVALVRIVADTYTAYADALQSSKAALALFEELGLKRLQANELLTIAVLNLERDSPEQAIPPAQQALDIFRRIGRDHGAQAVVLSTLVQAHNARDEEIQALQVSKEGLAWIQNAGDKRQEVIMQDTLAHAQLQTDNAEEALLTAKAGLVICKDLGDAEWEARLLLTTCQVYVKQQMFEKALKAVNDAIDIFKTLGDVEHDLAKAHHILADLLCFTQDYPRALNAAQQARDYFADIEEWNSEAMVLLLIASLTGDSQEALNTARQAQEVFKNSGEKRMESIALNAIADMQLASKDYEQALETVLSRRAVLNGAGFRREEAKSLHAIACVYQASGEPNLALRTAREGIRMARAEGDKIAEVHMSIQAVQASILLIADNPNDSKTTQSLSEDATKIAKDSVALSRKVGRGLLNGPALYWQGHLLQLLFSPDAIGVTNDALSCFVRNRDRLGEAHALLLLANCHISSGNRPKADQFAQSALAIFAEYGDEDGQAMVQCVIGQRPTEVTFYQPTQLAGDVASMQAAADVKPKGPDPLVVRNKIRQLVNDALESEDVSMDTPLMDSGLDSLASVSFRNEVSKEFSTNLPASLIFDYPTISGLTTYMVELLEDQ